MALIPKNSYPGQTISGDAGYPQGKARNQLVPDDGTGTPLEELWVNDLFGMQQALLNDAAITPSGVPDTVSTSQYLNALKTLFIYGKAGGTWAPSAPIVIGGAGLTISSPFVLDASGSADFNGFVTFDSVVTFNSSITVDGFPTFSQGFIVTSGDTEFNDDVLFTAPVIFQSDLTAQGTTSVTGIFSATGASVTLNPSGNVSMSPAGDLILGGSNDVNVAPIGDCNLVPIGALNIAPTGGATLQKTLAITGTGHIRRRYEALTDADLTRGINNADIFVMPDGTPGAPRTLTLSHTGAAAGDVIRVTNLDNGQTLAVQNPPSSAILTLRRDGTLPFWVDVVFDGAAWVRTASAIS
jgi:hypothetical protein